MRGRLLVAAVVILVAGVAAGLAVYVVADDEATHLGVYEMQISKQYVREIERFGGKTARLFDDLSRWFAERWRGKSLGVTIAFLAAGVSLVLYLVARRIR